jgi:hypothetical protein
MRIGEGYLQIGFPSLIFYLPVGALDAVVVVVVLASISR